MAEFVGCNGGGGVSQKWTSQTPFRGTFSSLDFGSRCEHLPCVLKLLSFAQVDLAGPSQCICIVVVYFHLRFPLATGSC